VTDVRRNGDTVQPSNLQKGSWVTGITRGIHLMLELTEKEKEQKRQKKKKEKQKGSLTMEKNQTISDPLMAPSNCNISQC